LRKNASPKISARAALAAAQPGHALAGRAEQVTAAAIKRAANAQRRRSVLDGIGRIDLEPDGRFNVVK
jgi:hypothetical protein